MPSVSELLASSTIHGIQRAAFVDSVPQCVAWLLLFAIATTFFTVHMALLSARYDGHPINTELSLDSEKFLFPDFYICNPITSTLSKSKLNEVDKQRLADFERQIKIQMPQLSSDSKRLLLERFLWSSTPASRMTWARSKYQTIIKATLNSQDLDLNSFGEVHHHIYQKCLKFLNNSLMQSPRDMLRLYLYADRSRLIKTIITSIQRYRNTLHTSREEDYELDESNGITFLFTEPNHYPNELVAERFSMPCGMQTIFRLESSHRTLLNTQQSPCRDHPEVVDIDDDIYPNMTQRYKVDRELCVDIQSALHYHQKCGCVPLTLPIPTTIQQKTAHCLDVNNWKITQAVDNWLCINNISDDEVQRLVVHKCRGENPCNREVYALHWSNSMWPTTKIVKSFVRNVLKQIYMQHKDVQHLREAWTNVLNASGASQVTLVRENIAKVDIRPKSQFSTSIKQTYAYPMINLLSDIGGILGLYLGMSVLSFFELGELVILVIRQRRARIERLSSIAGQSSTSSSS